MIIPGTETLYVNVKKLASVLIMKKSFWGHEKQIIAHPIDYDSTPGNKEIKFHRFVDENGKEYPYKISKQLNNFFEIPINKIN